MWHWFMLLTCHHENKHSINNNFINCNSTPYNRDTEHLKWAPLFAVGLEWMAFLNVFPFFYVLPYFSFPIFPYFPMYLSLVRSFTLCIRQWPHHACKPILGDHLGCSPVICSIRTSVSFPCQKCRSMLKLIVPLHSLQGQQVKGMVIIERRISKTLNMWLVIYHYP